MFPAVNFGKNLSAQDRASDVFPFQNRVDTLNCFVVSKDEAVYSYAGVTSFSESQSRSIVPFTLTELIENENESWYIRNKLRSNFYDVDLFGYTLPLRDETAGCRRSAPWGRSAESA